MEEDSCKNCRFYLPVDVFRGLCKLTKEQAGPDNPSCEKLERIPKCRYCGHYTSEKQFLGKCMGTILAYPDMIASKCFDFQWNRKN